MTGLIFSGDGPLQRFSNRLGELGARAPVALAHALNHTGAKAETAVIRIADEMRQGATAAASTGSWASSRRPGRATRSACRWACRAVDPDDGPTP